MTPPPLIALVGNPNAGKSALFNALTGARQKTGNYPGVTVERHSGRMVMPDGRPAELIDLPGTYSLEPASPDEAVTRNVVLGVQSGERRPDMLVIVVDAGNLEHHLRLTLELLGLGVPTVVALNMVDMAKRDGLILDEDKLAAALGVPVIATVAVRGIGIEALRAAIAAEAPAVAAPVTRSARDIARSAIISETVARSSTRMIDRVALHPIFGPIILAALLFLIFQAVFSWATPFADAIDSMFTALKERVVSHVPVGVFRSFLADGVIAGVGAVVVFLPQIIILFAFILVLEMSGYMVRAAFLMDRLMARVGLSGRAFIPLLSSFACAVPGIMATRTIEDPKDRLTTILIAPLMTCSARLPVYAVIISAFIPARTVLPGVGLQGLVLFGLYIGGIVGALIAALLLRRSVVKGRSLGFIMEMPRYQLPQLRDLIFGLWQRAWIFLRRAGTIILGSTVLLWVLLSFPRTDPANGISQINYSIAGRIANALEPLVAPIGFNRDIALALVPAMAAREVAVSALATVYAIDGGTDDATETGLVASLRSSWGLPTALAFLAWFVFAPQCVSTIAVVKRETNGWRWPLFLLAYLFGLAYLAAGATYWVALWLGL